MKFIKVVNVQYILYIHKIVQPVSSLIFEDFSSTKKETLYLFVVTSHSCIPLASGKH